MLLTALAGIGIRHDSAFITVYSSHITYFILTSSLQQVVLLYHTSSIATHCANEFYSSRNIYCSCLYLNESVAHSMFDINDTEGSRTGKSYTTRYSHSFLGCWLVPELFFSLALSFFL